MARLWSKLLSIFKVQDPPSVFTQETTPRHNDDFQSDTNLDCMKQQPEESIFHGTRFITAEDLCAPAEQQSPAPVKESEINDPLAKHPQCYIVLDIETTGLSPESDDIIEFGAIKIENGQETDCFNTFIDPGYPIPPYITQLTGITDTDVAGSPDLLTAIKDIAAFIGDFPVVAHNATFDLRFLFRAYQKADLQTNFYYIDTLTLSRYAFPDLASHSLSILIDYLGIGGTQEHRALSDVRLTYQIFCECCACLTHMDLSLFALPYPATRSQRQKQYRARAQAAIRDIECQKSAPDPNHPFYQKRILLTGAMQLPRQQIEQLLEACGAHLTSSVSKNTDYLVIGNQDIGRKTQGGMSSKEGKARWLNKYQDGEIQIINESEFFDLLSQNKKGEGLYADEGT